MSNERVGAAVPYVSDCPVQPHVWREFRGRPDTPLELIAHVRPEASAQVVAGTLRKQLSRDDSEPYILVYDRYVLVEVGFEEMLASLLPMTIWADLMRRINSLADSELAQEISAAKDRQRDAQRLTPSTRQGGSATHKVRGVDRASREVWSDLSLEDYGRLRWLLDQLVAVMPRMSTRRLKGIIENALSRVPDRSGPILSVGYNRWVEPAVNETRKTIKADAAEKLFDVDCSNVTWAVVDTGIDAQHPMFSVDTDVGPSTTYVPPSRVLAAYDISAGLAALRQRVANAMFAGLSDDADWEAFEAAAREGAVDPKGERFSAAANDHGTHVAGVLAGSTFRREQVGDHWQGELRGDEPDELRGICPTLRLIDVQVFDRDGRSREFEVVVGLAFIAWLNRQPNNRIDGVNISLSIPFAIDNFACGGTPVCLACDKLVADGIVVVASAGNSGFDDNRGTTSLGSGFQMISISDPGNADDVITVGATHRTDPHRFGPISRSARGPTADGRNKPDLLAPGDRVWGPLPNFGWGQKSGTSQAAPHVSGVAAMLLARYPELRGRPRRVKQIVCETATDLRRLVHFQGHGLVDALRALQRP